MAQAIDPKVNNPATQEADVEEYDPCGCRSGKKYKECRALRMKLGKAGLVVSPLELLPPEGTNVSDIVCSQLSCEVSLGDFHVVIAIYRYATEQEWIVEVQNDHDGTHHWDDPFPTEQAALDAAFEDIEEQGFENFAVNPFD
jgi:hypothetical protein